MSFFELIYGPISIDFIEGDISIVQFIDVQIIEGIFNVLFGFGGSHVAPLGQDRQAGESAV